MHSNKQNAIEYIEAGDIGAAVGFKDIKTGDTLSSEKNPIILESMIFPDPVIGVAVEPKTKADIDKLGMSLAKLAEEDPTFQVKTDEASGQTVISGMGELHLDIIVDRLKREFKVEVNQGKPQVEYKGSQTQAAFVLGSTATPITGCGNIILSRIIWLFSEDKVSPVLISLKPTAAPISPASMYSIAFCLLECIWYILEILSFESVLLFKT
jgi:hypothetical protein